MTGIRRRSPDDEAAATHEELRAAVHRLDYLMLEIEAVVDCGPTLEDSVRTAVECFFDVVDDGLLAFALANRGRQPRQLQRTAAEQALHRLAEVIRMIEPALAPVEARLAAGSIARVALAYRIAPELPRARAIEELAELSLTILDRAHR